MVTRRGIAVASLGSALVAIGLFWRYPGVVGMGGALFVLTVLSLATVLRPTRIEVARTVSPPEVNRGDACLASLRVSRRGGLLPMRLRGIEQASRVPVPVLIPRISPKATVETAYTIPTDRRGVHTVGPLEVRRRGVAGLAERCGTFGGVTEYRVLPRVLPVRGLPAGLRRGAVGADERLERGGTDLVGLREYTPGDDLRRLHWATSARTGTLMVREDADPSLAHLTVLLDDRASSYGGAGLEDAVEVVASLAVAAAEAGNGLHLLTLCGQIDAEDEPDLLVHRLAEVTGRELSGEPSLVTDKPDLIVVVTGGLAALGPLVLMAGRSGAGVVAVVDDTPAPPTALGQVTVLRGGSSERLITLWDNVVVT